MQLISSSCRNKLFKLTILIVLSYQIVEAVDYCSLCEDHIACRNYGVCSCQLNVIYMLLCGYIAINFVLYSEKNR